MIIEEPRRVSNPYFYSTKFKDKTINLCSDRELELGSYVYFFHGKGIVSKIDEVDKKSKYLETIRGSAILFDSDLEYKYMVGVKFSNSPITYTYKTQYKFEIGNKIITEDMSVTGVIQNAYFVDTVNINGKETKIEDLSKIIGVVNEFPRYWIHSRIKNEFFSSIGDDNTILAVKSGYSKYLDVKVIKKTIKKSRFDSDYVILDIEDKNNDISNIKIWRLKNFPENIDAGSNLKIVTEWNDKFGSFNSKELELYEDDLVSDYQI